MENTKQKKQKLSPCFIDCDTGIDDAVAIAYAAYQRRLDIKLIVASTGNCASSQSAKNTSNLLHAIKKDGIEVIQGEANPIGKKTIRISVHGQNGLGDYEFNEDGPAPTVVDPADAIHKKLIEIPEMVSFICLGPATNLAAYLKKYPRDINQIDTIYFSGGLLEDLKPGELPYVGFNVGFDPAAMEILLNSKIAVVICPSDLGHVAYFDWQDVMKIKKSNKTGEMFEKIFRKYHDRHVKNGIATHDLCAFMTYSDKQFFEFKKADVTVKYYDKLATGVLSIDLTKQTNRFFVATNVDSKKLKRKFFSVLNRMP